MTVRDGLGPSGNMIIHRHDMTSFGSAEAVVLRGEDARDSDGGWGDGVGG